MKKLTLQVFLLVGFVLAMTNYAAADTIPLPALSGVGANYVVPGGAGETFQLYAYYGGFSAGDTSLSFLNDPSVGLFKNKGSGANAIGDVVFLGNFTGGTTLVFRLDNLNTGASYFTGTNNAAVQAFAGGTFNGVTFPPGALVRFEDRPVLNSDQDYNDLVFSVSAKPVPEPATMLLLGSGLAGVAGAIRRKRKAQK